MFLIYELLLGLGEKWRTKGEGKRKREREEKRGRGKGKGEEGIGKRGIREGKIAREKNILKNDDVSKVK